MTTLAQRIARWPKAELHLHLEGSIRPATLCELAARHRQPMDAETVAALYRYHSFRGFLNAFKRVTALLRTPDDYALITQRLTEELLAQNVIYAEVIVSAGVMLRRQQDVEANFAAICEAARPAERRGLRLAWSFDAVRQFGLAHIWRVARLAVQLGSQGVVAFGVGGDETALPTRSLQPVYEFVAAHGLHRLIHAGEIGPPSAVREAVEVLGCERIGHGIAALRDPHLQALLIEHGTVLELCPTSNLRTGALARQLRRRKAGLRDHPLPQFFRAGIPVVLATDDPALFETTLVREYEQAARLGLSVGELRRLAAMSFRAAFLPERARRAMLRRFRAAC
ncbi:MAG: adenosine deaminase [Acidobacteriia bacterium]|jgi:adenosine deaminase/aminodeoxyfutalosine deaminase|nr:adenosine deaminase [Terriglobia bacterium]